VERAKNSIRKNFPNFKNQPISRPFCQRQIQVLFDSDFFPWITNKALNDLVKYGFLIQKYENLFDIKLRFFYRSDYNPNNVLPKCNRCAKLLSNFIMTEEQDELEITLKYFDKSKDGGTANDS
jgi:hypothetical protein